MNITADRLRSQTSSTQFIDKYVKDILSAIQDRILDANRNSRTCILFGAPVNFDVPDMDNTDASVMIYYKVIRHLEKNGFDVKCEMTKSETRFIINWLSHKKNNNIDHMLNYIINKRVDVEGKVKPTIRKSLPHPPPIITKITPPKVTPPVNDSVLSHDNADKYSKTTTVDKKIPYLFDYDELT